MLNVKTCRIFILRNIRFQWKVALAVTSMSIEDILPNGGQTKQPLSSCD